MNIELPNSTKVISKVERKRLQRQFWTAATLICAPMAVNAEYLHLMNPDMGFFKAFADTAVTSFLGAVLSLAVVEPALYLPRMFSKSFKGFLWSRKAELAGAVIGAVALVGVYDQFGANPGFKGLLLYPTDEYIAKEVEKYKSQPSQALRPSENAKTSPEGYPPKVR